MMVVSWQLHVSALHGGHQVANKYLFIARKITYLDYLGGVIAYNVKVFEISTSEYKKFAYCT
jgi:hypothetical protein